MATFPTEVLAIIAQFVAPGDLPNFRLTSKACEELSKRSFTNKCFQHMKTSASINALDLLFAAVNHQQYGPAVERITITMKGVDDDPMRQNTRFSDIFRVLHQRNQQVAVEIFVTATDLRNNHYDNYRVVQVIRYLTRLDLRFNLFASPLTFSAPSPSLLSSIDVPGILASITNYCTQRSFSLNYTDAQASVDYDVTTKTIIISGLTDRLMVQTCPLIGWLTIKHVLFTHCERNEDTEWTVDFILRAHASTLVDIEIEIATKRLRTVTPEVSKAKTLIEETAATLEQVTHTHTPRIRMIKVKPPEALRVVESAHPITRFWKKKHM